MPLKKCYASVLEKFSVNSEKKKKQPGEELFILKPSQVGGIDWTVPPLLILGLLNTWPDSEWKRRGNFRKPLSCSHKYSQRCALPPRILNYLLIPEGYSLENPLSASRRGASQRASEGQDLCEVACNLSCCPSSTGSCCCPGPSPLSKPRLLSWNLSLCSLGFLNAFTLLTLLSFPPTSLS